MAYHRFTFDLTIGSADSATLDRTAALRLIVQPASRTQHLHTDLQLHVHAARPEFA